MAEGLRSLFELGLNFFIWKSSHVRSLSVVSRCNISRRRHGGFPLVDP